MEASSDLRRKRRGRHRAPGRLRARRRGAVVDDVAGDREGVPRRELAALLGTRRGQVLLGAWCLLLAVAVAGACALAPYAIAGQQRVSVRLDLDDGILAAVLGGVLLVQCVRIAGRRAVIGIAGLVFGVCLMLFAVGPAIAAGAPPAISALVGALLMTVVTLGLTYAWDSVAVAVAGTVAMAVTLVAVTALAASVVPLVAPDEPRLVAAAVLHSFGGLCDVTVTQVSTVMGSARILDEKHKGAERLDEIRSTAMRTGADHLTSMIHTLCFAMLSGVALQSTLDLGPELVGVLVGGIAMAFATWRVTQLSSWAIGGIAVSALSGVKAHAH